MVHSMNVHIINKKNLNKIEQRIIIVNWLAIKDFVIEINIF